MTVNNRKEVARNMKRLREEQGLSIEELSVRSGLSVRHIKMLERESVPVSIDAQYRLCRAFDIGYKELVGYC